MKYYSLNIKEILPCVIQRADGNGQEGDGFYWHLCHRGDDGVFLPTLKSPVNDDDGSNGTHYDHYQPYKSGYLPGRRLAQEIGTVDGG